MKIEENERLAALLTAQQIAEHYPPEERKKPATWRAVYERRLREFMELEKAERQSSCPLVGCERPMPHEHKIEGPVDAS